MSKEHGGMGFQHLSAFNLALLGKQTWCLMSQPDLLVWYPVCIRLSIFLMAIS